jgi:biotin carboxylase
VTPRVLLLSATTGYQLRSFDEAARHLGVDLVFATDRCHSLDDPWQDSAIPVRFHDEAASVQAIRDAAAIAPFAGVIAVGDRPTALAAQAAAALGLPGNPVDAVRIAASKLESRRRFAAAGLATPRFSLLPPDDDGSRLPAGLAFPVVVKPLHLSGSRGVIRCDDEREYCTAVRRVQALLARAEIRVLRLTDGDRLLVEEFIDGREFALEGVLHEGQLQTLALFDKPDPLDGPFFEETIYATPSALDEQAQRRIRATVQAALQALGLSHGAVHAECRVGPHGVVMLEVAARPIGGLCSRVLQFDPPGSGNSRRSLEELLLRQAVGEDVRGWQRERAAAAVMMIPIPKRGLLKKVTGEERARDVVGVDEVRITAKRDQLLEPLPEAGSYLGFIFARGADAGGAVASVRQAHAELTFSIDAAIGVAGA